MKKTLVEALNELQSLRDKEYNSLYLPDDYYVPGYIVALTAFLHFFRVENRDFDCHEKISGYLDAMALSDALWQNGNYQQVRCNVGRNYSIITPLHSIESVDTATQSINSCIRTLINNRQSQGISNLLHVVGELHDNIWSHGLSSGFSMAQKSQVPLSQGNDYYFEFAVADHGLGFLAEMRRTGLKVSTHREAIEWCIREGHSTKHSDDIDEWAQTVPSDMQGGNPFGSGVSTRSESNHHQGLGLYHLIKLVKGYGGELILASGDAYFQLLPSGEERYTTINNMWQGVAISCTLKESMICQDIEDESLESDKLLNEIMEKLGG